MAKETHEYLGRKIELEAESQSLTIDGKPVRVIQNATGGYSSVEHYYADYGSLLELARDLIRQRAV